MNSSCQQGIALHPGSSEWDSPQLLMTVHVPEEKYLLYRGQSNPANRSNLEAVVILLRGILKRVNDSNFKQKTPKQSTEL